MYNKKRTILIASLVSACINSFLAILKIIVGTMGHSQALIADGFHSFSDLMSDAFVYIATVAGSRKPDSHHPYGHQRIETMGTVLIAFLLIIIGGSICYDAVNRLIHHAITQTPSYPVVVIAVISIIANEWLFYYTRTKGESINSTLLISNAWHNRSDAFVSILVLLSVVGSMLGWPWLDAAGAIIIALLIIKMGGQMIWSSIKELIDSGVDSKTLKYIQEIIQSVHGVRSIHQLRTRLHGNNIFVDCHIIVDPFISVSEGHHIGEQVHLTLLKHIKNLTDVTMHIDPEDDKTIRPSSHLPNRKIVKEILAARWSRLPGYHQIQKMTLHYLEGHLHIELVMTNALINNQTPTELLKLYKQSTKDIHEIADITIHFK